MSDGSEAPLPFWRAKTLEQMSPSEWESLCDGCARCCLVKLEEEDNGQIHYTDLGCTLLDGKTCRCRDYPNRQRRVKDCVKLTPETVRTLPWLPVTCAYRVVADGRDLAWWHPLVSGSPDTVHEAGVSVRGRVAACEDDVPQDDWPDHIVRWPNRPPRRRDTEERRGELAAVAPLVSTTPNERGAMSEPTNIHTAAAEGFAAGARTYAAGRPDYPVDIENWLRDDLGLAPGRSALDLGAGTGKFIARLRATGARMFAVEPVREMRKALVAAHPDVVALEGTAERIPLSDGGVDAIVCAQSFHWFATRAALAEMRRVLKTGGVLGLIWNVRDESVPWVAQLTRILAPYEGETPRFGSGRWRDVFPAAGFSVMKERRSPHAHVGPAERVIVDRLLSTSFIAALPPEEREHVAARVREVIRATPALTESAEVAFPYETRAFSCVKQT